MIDFCRRIDNSDIIYNIKTINIKKELYLNPDIGSQHTRVTVNQPIKQVLITGATGFLGIHLLNELIQQTDATIYCLVRSQSLQGAINRLQNTLKQYSLPTEQIEKRIIPILGDLSQKRLGLTSNDYDFLTKEIDVIYHNGAEVNFLAPYEKLKASNVNSTKELLLMASINKLKPIHYVSSVSVFDSHELFGKIATEESNPVHVDTLYMGYSQSKWVSEKLLEQAHLRGIPIKIYRPGRIAGNSKINKWNMNDLFCTLIQWCIDLKLAPLIDVSMDLVPVDYLSHAIVWLSLSDKNTYFHMINPDHTNWNQVVGHLKKNELSMDVVPYVDWLKQVRKHPKRSESFSGIISFLESIPNLEKRYSTENNIIINHDKMTNYYSQYPLSSTEELIESFVNQLKSTSGKKNELKMEFA